MCVRQKSTQAVPLWPSYTAAKSWRSAPHVPTSHLSSPFRGTSATPHPGAPSSDVDAEWFACEHVPVVFRQRDIADMDSTS